MYKRGFTLVELLVVMGIIALLAAILIPVVSNAKKTGTKATCMNNMREIGAAVIAYRQDKSVFPDPAQSVLQSALLNEKKLGNKKSCPIDTAGNDSYSALYNYWGYKKEKTPLVLGSLADAQAVYSDSALNKTHHYWHPNGYPDSDFPGLANPNCPTYTIVTICNRHTDMAGKYVVLRKDGHVDFVKPDDGDDKFWMLSTLPK